MTDLVWHLISAIICSTFISFWNKREIEWSWRQGEIISIDRFVGYFTAALVHIVVLFINFLDDLGHNLFFSGAKWGTFI